MNQRHQNTETFITPEHTRSTRRRPRHHRTYRKRLLDPALALYAGLEGQGAFAAVPGEMQHFAPRVEQGAKVERGRHTRAELESKAVFAKRLNDALPFLVFAVATMKNRGWEGGG